MDSYQLTTEQYSAANHNQNPKVYLTGCAGCGKSTAATARLMNLAGSGEPASSILIIIPQRSLSAPYDAAMQRQDFPSGSLPEITTFGGLARRMISLFWPVISAPGGFKKPHRPPTFLTLETSQYYMSSIVNPMIQKGSFDAVKLEPNRLYSQILDNLNKSALIGTPHTQFAQKMIDCAIGEPQIISPLDQAQSAANQFRNMCYQLNLLDFSLQIEVFYKHLWPSIIFRNYLFKRYKHLIYDNVEEDAPIFHDMIKEWAPFFDSMLLVHDSEAGYRSFLGADPVSAKSLQSIVHSSLELTQSFVSQVGIVNCSSLLHSAIHQERIDPDPDTRNSFTVISSRHIPEAIQHVAEQIQEVLRDQKTAENEIVIIAPYLSDSLLFSISQKLNSLGIPSQGHRPSRSLNTDPAVSSLVSLAKLVNPQWDKMPSRFDMREAFMQLLTRGDLVRADLLSQVLFQPKNKEKALSSFDTLQADMRNRIGYSIGDRYMRLQTWLTSVIENPVPELDVFWSRLFGELLSQRDMGFHASFTSSGSAAMLIESYQKFRQVMEPNKSKLEKTIAFEYIELVESGVISAFYKEPWQKINRGVLIAPAYTYLLTNRPVKIQFWLDIGSPGWWQRPFQPLTHPYVLSRNWQSDKIWTDAEELRVSRESLSKLVAGLLQRCRAHVYFYSVEYDERGNQNKTGLLQALNTITRKFAAKDLAGV